MEKKKFDEMLKELCGLYVEVLNILEASEERDIIEKYAHDWNNVLDKYNYNIGE